MKTQEQKHAEFQQVIKLVMEWLNDNFHPHTKIIIDCNNAELLEGIMIVNNVDHEE
jgi:hypothetical protein